MTQAEELLRLCEVYHELPDDDPEKLTGMNRFAEACEAAVRKGYFDGRYNAPAIRQIIEAQWRSGRRAPKD